ncbi:hypothetical protein AYO44_03750 [Planctomycetaceae bacterium SCGC AG-212-F19]|nr:hypothetical protein AYO44_03750 [Planctomycetaceae bacterium SCGC AG-212-F19]
MSDGNSTRATASSKPAKPSPTFPLFPHATRRWAKKIRGKLHYFGKVDDSPGHGADAALKLYLQQKDALHAGLTPRDTSEALTVYTLTAKFLTTKERLMEAGDLSPHSYHDYVATTKLILKAFGRNRLVTDLRPDDFEKLRAKLAKGWGPVRLGNEVNRVRIVFNYGWKSGLLDKPIVFGEGFRRPSKKKLRQHRQAQGLRMFEAEEVRRMLGCVPWRPAAGDQLTAMILLAVNCGFGNEDCAALPVKALDLQGGWVNHPRPKTGIERRCPLWPETIEALRVVLADRRKPKAEADAGLVFITKYGGNWRKRLGDSPISKEARKLLDSLGINGHRNFYCLRHTFQTIGDDCGDFIAVRVLMGHASSDIADAYRERISDARLRKVTEHLRGWLFGVAKA